MSTRSGALTKNPRTVVVPCAGVLLIDMPPSGPVCGADEKVLTCRRASSLGPGDLPVVRGADGKGTERAASGQSRKYGFGRADLQAGGLLEHEPGDDAVLDHGRVPLVPRSEPTARKIDLDAHGPG